MLNAGRLAEVLTDRFGVPLTGVASESAEGKRTAVSPRDVPRTRGFSVEVLIGWRTVEAQFIPGTYAAELLGSMGEAAVEKRAAFAAFIRAAMNHGAKIEFSINDGHFDALVPGAWPSAWQSLGLKMSAGPMVIDGSSELALDALALTWSSRLLGAILALMPLEPVQTPSGGEAEGGGEQVLITRYERSQINRAACIEIHGTKCKVCGFDFGETYGVIGEGFIEVHHLEPVSGIEAGTIVDPATDLAPVCPNCHAMLHKRKPPYSIDELRSMLHRL
jgi:5-methylcytosine-specific restriction enzyme A